MQFDGIALGAGFVALVVFFIAIKLLLSPRWIAGWLRGNIGLLFLALAAGLALAIIDIRTYSPMLDGQPLATMSFEKKGMQSFKVRLVDNNGMENSYQLQGDAWKLDVKVIDWPPSLYVWGLLPGYRFNALEGKYFSLVMERQKQAEELVLSRSDMFDIWSLAKQYFQAGGIIQPKLVAIPAQPMVDGAQYEIVASNGRLLARPLNEAARQAL